MKKLFLIPLMIVLAVGLVFSGCAAPAPGPAPAKVYELKLQCAYPRGDLSMETLAVFVDAADRRSNGQLKIELFAAPEIVGMFEVPEAVKKGTLDLGMETGGFWAGVLPVGDVEFSLPYAYRIPEDDTYKGSAEIVRNFFFDSGFLSLLREEYAKQGVYYLDIHSYGPVPFMVATKPIKTVDDFKGTPIRTDSMWMEWHNRIGATGVDIPGDEAYMALKLGTIDAHIWDVSLYTGMGFEEVAPYWIRGEENDHSIGHIIVNMNVWNSLSPDLQEALAGAGEDYWYAVVDVYENAIIQCYEMAKQGVITEVWMDDELIALHEKVAHELWDEYAQKDAACATAVALIKEWRGFK